MSDLSDLFALNPLSYTKEQGQLAQIIEKMRASRKQFSLGNKMAGSTKPPTAAGKAKVELSQQTLSIIDKLDLEL